MENKDFDVVEQVKDEQIDDSSKIEKMRNNKKKAIIIASISLALSIALVTTLIIVFVFNYTFPVYLLTYKNIDDLKLDYKLDSTYSYVENINYKDYLVDASYKEKDAIFISNIHTLSEDPKANGEILNALFYNISLQGGAVVVFDVSIKTTPITLCDDVEIVIEKDVVVELPTYEYTVDNSISYSQVDALFYAKDADNIKISGPGTIKGNGVSYTNEPESLNPFMPLETFNLKERVLKARARIRKAKDSANRPHLIHFIDCEDVKIDNLILNESATWTVKIENCEDVNIENIVINNNIYVQNADGIDIVSSQDVNIQHCFIATADDGICIKANKEEKSENIKVNRCTVLSLANCFKIGTETSKDINKISLTNCYFFIPQISGGYAGIAIESVDGSNINDVYVDNISMKGISSPLLIWLGNRLEVKNGSIGKIGSIKNLSISNVKCEDVEMASAITGCVVNGESQYVQDVRLANFDVKYRQATENLNIGPANFEQNSNGYPEITRVLHQYIISHEASIYYDLPVYGVFARHVKGFKVINYKVEGRNNTIQQKDNITQEDARYDTEKVFLR